jgi:hypothetical protein
MVELAAAGEGTAWWNRADLLGKIAEEDRRST